MTSAPATYESTTLAHLAARGKTLYATLSENRPACTVYSSADAGADFISAVHAAGANLFCACAEGMRMQGADGSLTTLALPRSLSSVEADFSVLPVGDRWYFGAEQDGLISAKPN